MTKKTAEALLLKYQAGTTTEKENALVEDWLLKGFDSELDLQDEELLSDLLEIRNRIGIDHQTHKISLIWFRVAAAACILFFLSIGGYLLFSKDSKAERLAQNRLHDVPAGGNKAILSFGNGKKINLTNARNGLIALKKNLSVTKTADGRLVYQANSLSQGGVQPTLYDTLTVPRGGQYELILPDGSKAWLNAATSIRYPEKFAGNERKVELIYGEADFEVKHNAAMPFRVSVAGQLIEDVGTNFNINDYNDEPAVKTTLIEGSINVLLLKSSASSAKNELTLKPGQQLTYLRVENSTVINNVDADATVDWKNGEFNFKNESLVSIMRRVSRWYDVNVVYQDKISTITFSGSLPRFSSLSKVLEKLEGSGDVRFRIDGKRIIVFK